VGGSTAGVTDVGQVVCVCVGGGVLRAMGVNDRPRECCTSNVPLMLHFPATAAFPTNAAAAAAVFRVRL